MNIIKDKLRLLCTPDFERATLVLAVLCMLSVMGVLLYLARRSGKSYLNSWAAGFLFYAVYLATAIRVHIFSANPAEAVVTTLMLGLSAVFMFLGDSEMAGQSRKPRELKLVALWAVLGGWWIRDKFLVMLPVCVLLGLARCLAGYLYLRNSERNRGTKLLFVAFVLWGAHSLAVPFLRTMPWMLSLMYVLSSVLALFIAIGMIVDEESKMADQKFRVIFNSIQDAVFMVNVWTLKIIDANTGAAQLTKRKMEELMGASFTELCPELKQGANAMENRQLLNALFKPYSEVQMVRGGGKQVVCEGETNLVHWQGTSALQINAREVADKGKSGRLVRGAEKLASIGQLVAGVAHELNNPLAVVVACAQMMARRKQISDKEHDNVLRMLHESERASKIVRDLLSFARPCEPQLESTNLNEIINNVLNVREDEFRLRNIDVVRELSPTLPLTKADRIQIEQVVTNLVTNAIYALSAQKSGRVLTLRTEKSGSILRLTIVDNGPGIRHEIMGRIFDPFFTTKPPGQGTGLGLSICSTIAVEHGGKLWVESQIGRGAKFFLELPLVPCKAQAPVNPATLGTDKPLAVAANQRLLVVDDEPGLREVLCDILNTCGYSADSACNGVEAMERLAAAPYDLIISDLCMPDMDGETLYKRVREQHTSLADNMIFLTGDTISPKSRIFLEHTGNRWLGKPFNVSTIEDVVSRALLEGNRSQPQFNLSQN